MGMHIKSSVIQKLAEIFSRYSEVEIELPKEIVISEELIEKARVLDNYYIPARYPDSHPDGAPFEHYGSLQSEEAVKYACEILKFVRTQMA